MWDLLTLCCHYTGAPDPYDLEFTDADFMGVNTTHDTEVGSEKKVEREEGAGRGGRRVSVTCVCGICLRCVTL